MFSPSLDLSPRRLPGRRHPMLAWRFRWPGSRGNIVFSADECKSGTEPARPVRSGFAAGQGSERAVHAARGCSIRIAVRWRSAACERTGGCTAVPTRQARDQAGPDRATALRREPASARRSRARRVVPSRRTARADDSTPAGRRRPSDSVSQYRRGPPRAARARCARSSTRGACRPTKTSEARAHEK